MKWYKYDINNLSEKDYEYYYSLMSEDKKKRVENFRFENDKKRTVAGEMLSRKVIAEHLSIDESSIVFSKCENGKPYAKELDIEFSISHSGDIVVCAISDKPIGIDVEKIRPINLRVAKRICDEKEFLYIFSHKPDETDFSYTEDEGILTRFFELWTKKEAYAKCSGKGLSAGLCFTPKIDSIVEDGYVVSIYKE
ncbi:MAG: 4'-phosphopantetheinyl transferase superfamily protein [Ruminococcus sp.]|nr:4'-phosphopantetheinyl transferase superfamily protein [Ruminococcus sp.]